MRHLSTLIALSLTTVIAAPLGCSGDDSSTNTGGAGATSQGGTSQGGTSQGGTSQGGTSQGGTSQGGTSQGGNGQGGTAAGGSGQGGTAPAEPECNGPGECTLVDDCCTCAAIPVGTTPPLCNDQLCDSTKCEELGLGSGGILCVAHQCVAGFNCNESQTMCDMIPPNCDDGMTPSVEGDCWGPCVPADECEFVTACTNCSGPGLVCVLTSVGPSERAHCVPIPAACGAEPTCECMGAAVCGAIPCVDGADGLLCSTQ